MDRKKLGNSSTRRDEGGGRRPSQKELEAARKERERRQKEKLSRAAPRPVDRREQTRRSGGDPKRPMRQAERSAVRRPETGVPAGRREERVPRPKSASARPRVPEESGKPRRALPMWTRVLLVLVGVLVLFGTLSLTVLFPITNIEVVGKIRYKPEEIVQESGIITGQNFFLSGKDSDVRIEKGLPYVKDAVVRKKLFSTVVIEVTEAVPCVCVKNEKQWNVLDADGKVLEKVDKPPTGVILLSGISVDKAELGETVIFFEEGKEKTLWNLYGVLSTNQVQGITQINLNDPYDVRILYRDRIEVQLGIPSELDTKVRHAMRVIRGELSETDQGMLDISGGKYPTFSPSYDIKSLWEN